VSQDARSSIQSRTKSTGKGGRAVTEEAPSTSQDQSQKRKPVLQEETIEDLQPTYQYLAAVTRYVPRAVIDAKWSGLPITCADQVSQLLQDIQKPVIARLRDAQHQSQASSALHNISRKVVRKISKGLPFPPSTCGNREDDFDFEGILDHNRGLENQLDSVLHSNNLLDAQLSKELSLLEEERHHLEALENNAKAGAIKRKQEIKAVHLYLQGTDQDSHNEVQEKVLELQFLEQQSLNNYNVSVPT
jgi:hypothetical protein